MRAIARATIDRRSEEGDDKNTGLVYLIITRQILSVLSVILPLRHVILPFECRSKKVQYCPPVLNRES